MTIHERLQKDKFTNLDDRPLLALIQGEICVDGKPMGDKDAVIRLSQMSKTCDKNVELYKKSDNYGQALKEVEFQTLIKTYMPQGAEKKDVEQAIAQLAVEPNMKSMGTVMGYLKNKFEVVDGNLVKSVLLGGL